MSEYAIRLIDVKKTFDGKEYVVNGMNLDIIKGSLTAIIGFSGTGKSVMLKHILGLFMPTSGTVEVLGQNITKMSKNDITSFRKKFGVLFQGAALFDDMSVLENVCPNCGGGFEKRPNRPKEKLLKYPVKMEEYRKSIEMASFGILKEEKKYILPQER